MARIAAAKGGGVSLAGARRGGRSQLKIALVGVLVLGGTLGLLNMTPRSLHTEMHTSNTRKELRELTEGTARARLKPHLQEGGDLESAADISAAADASTASSSRATAQIVEHVFETSDGTEADDSLTAEQKLAAKQQEEEAERLKQEAASSDVNETPGEKYHVVCSLGSGIYTQWQSRVSYYWYLKTKAACDAAGSCPMGGYTRLLHSGEPDDYMAEIPTVVVEPLPPEYQALAAGYVVLDRPFAFKQWVEQHLHKIPENYIWMGEPDHLFIRPPPLWATPERPAAFPFFYIEPARFKSIIDRFNPKDVPITQFDAIGNSPVQIHKRQFAALADNWHKLSIRIKNDTEADKEFGWVQEMYAYSIAAATTLDQPVRHQLHVEMQLQPPWDTSLTSENGKEAYMIHFTYGDDFDEKGQFTPGKVGHWHWDKRDYTNKYPPRNFPMPPEGCTNECVKELIRRVNEAADNLPRWAEFEAELFAPVAPNFAEQFEVKEQRRRRNALGTRPQPGGSS
ncbi:hypothetical protein D9Q98_008513 [Chlorella vulgaris]|uniref:Hydroxyproline O-arabinosyltransferase-like domain-containing protein n=1 Tax=Chlorella vulgaris TaxID=3077 RepID=A0A9D4YU12_CHLVU|nr:hypothetical protein D9Q98_008513 [Chlorella vulgaris]